jgi:hypothetical protein
MVDVEITFFDTNKGIYASGVYRSDLFSSETIERFMTNLPCALERFATDPQTRIAHHLAPI